MEKIDSSLVNFYTEKMYEVLKDVKMEYGSLIFLSLETEQKGKSVVGISLKNLSTREAYEMVYRLVTNERLKAPWYRKLQLAFKILFL